MERPARLINSERLALLSHGQTLVEHATHFREADLVLLKLPDGTKFGVLVQSGRIEADDITEMAYWKAVQTGKVAVKRA